MSVKKLLIKKNGVKVNTNSLAMAMYAIIKYFLSLLNS